MMTSVMMKLNLQYDQILNMEFHTLKRFIDILVEIKKAGETPNRDL